ncbi:O-antigen ligase family protein [Mucilaginibacter antarcticus]|uniref:O-antigen ligase family protein n=1 Tax=Mucilaginibacter antarcticus TaxID=1855725 RepID=A0ABW5XN77_9SPHI
MSIPVFTPLYTSYDGTGTFTSKIFITIPLMASVALLFIQKHKSIITYYKNERWIYAILALVVISICNPYNFAKLASIAFAITMLSYVCFFKLVSNYITPAEVVKAVFASFMFLCVLQFILALLYPLMGVSFVTTLFQAGGEEWSTREGTRAGAIGVFVTPANLGLYTTIASTFFFATYLSNYRKTLSLILLFASAATIILTFSRTSYITLVFVLFIVFFIYRNSDKALFSIKTVFLGILPALLVVYWLIFYSPLSDVFLKTDADDMYQARLDHWLIGLEIFKRSPIIGVGVNTHVEYINHSISFVKEIHNKFLSSNPIHNTHIIIMAETGIIGFIAWIYFIFSSIIKAKKNLAINNNVIFSLTQIGLIITFVIYGFTDWAPLSNSTFPIFLLFNYFNNKYSVGL